MHAAGPDSGRRASITFLGAAGTVTGSKFAAAATGGDRRARSGHQAV